MSTFVYPHEQHYRRVEQLLDPNYPVLLGLGRTTPWDIEATPPQPNATRPDIDELFIYIPFTTKRAVIRVPFATDDSFTIDNKYYYVTPVSSIEDIREKSVRSILLQTEVDNNILDVDSFRSLGVYTIRNLKSVSDGCYTSFSPSEIETTPIYFHNFVPIQVQEDVSLTVKVVITIGQ